jgi:soluble lytic murein transglycosylase-like protein
MFKESSFIDTVMSPVGAKGLMQLMPDTRKTYYELLRVDTLNLDKNQEDIYIGMNMLLDLQAYWTDRGNSEKYSWKLSLASYNAGKGRVLQYKGIPPYKETQDFVVFILKAHSNPVFYANILQKNENSLKDRS